MTFALHSPAYLFPNPPLEIASPMRYPFTSHNTALEQVNKLNGKVRVFYSLYSTDYLIIDKIFFDFDSINSLKNTQKLMQYCIEKKLKHSIVFSGGGFHFYIFSQNKDVLKNPKSALAEAQREIMDENGFTSSIDVQQTDVDGHIIGDVRRVATLPATYNTKRKRWAISLSHEEVRTLTYDQIQKLAKIQRKKIFVYDGNKYDIDKYKDIEHTNNFNIAHQINEAPDFNIDNDEELDMFPPCMQRAMLNIDESGDYRARWICTIWAKELGITPEKFDEIAKKYFGRVVNQGSLNGRGSNYDHWKKTRVADYVYNNDTDLPACERMMTEGRCPGKCKMYLTVHKNNDF